MIPQRTAGHYSTVSLWLTAWRGGSGSVYVNIVTLTILSEECLLIILANARLCILGRKNLITWITSWVTNAWLQTTVTEEKGLGVVISSDMKSSQQCTQAYSKASRMSAMINRTIVYKNSENLLRLYKSLVRPHLEYCTAAWSPHYTKDRVLLEKVQRRFTRMVPGLKKLPYEERLSELELWTLGREGYEQT